jgi:hypothetical protein
MNRPEDNRDRVEGARREWFRRMRSLIGNWQLLTREERLRERRELDEVSARARIESLLHPLGILQPFADLVTITGVKPFHNRVRDYEEELTRLEKTLLTSDATQQVQRHKIRKPTKRALERRRHNDAVMAVIRENPQGFKDQATYCRALERAGIQTPIEWIEEGCLRSYVDANKTHPTPDCPINWQERIRKEKGRAVRRLRLRKKDGDKIVPPHPPHRKPA